MRNFNSLPDVIDRQMEKLAIGMDPTDNFQSYDPTPTSPSVYRAPTSQYQIDPKAHHEAVTKAPASMFYPMVVGPVAAAGAITTSPAWGPAVAKAAPNVAKGVVKYGPKAAKAWWTTGGSLMRSASPIARALGYLYRGAAVGGPILAYGAKGSGYGEKLPGFVRENAINAANLGAAPAVTIATAKAVEHGVPLATKAYSAARRRFPDTTKWLSDKAVRFADNFRKDESVNIRPTYMGERSGTVGAAKDVVATLAGQIPGVADIAADAAIPAASNAYFRAAEKIDRPEARRIYEQSWPQIESQIRKGMSNPRGIIQQGKDILSSGVDRMRDVVSGNLSPEEIESASRLAKDVGIVSPVIADDIRDAREILGTNNVNRAALARDIAVRTAPVALGVSPDVADAVRLGRERFSAK